MAKRIRANLGSRVGYAVTLLLIAAGAAQGQGSEASAPPAAPAPASAASAVERRVIPVPRIAGRLTRRDIGLVVNTADPYSVEVGAFYAKARGLRDEQVLRVELPVRARLSEAEFDALREKIAAGFPATIQALALAWTVPYAVGCNSITGALALGHDAELCKHSCAPSHPSRYFNSATARPFTDLALRPSMLLAARDVDTARRLIERGVAADGTLGRRGAPPVHAHFVTTSDRVRSVRSGLFPPAGSVPGLGVQIDLDATQALVGAQRVLLYMTGRVQVESLDTIGWVPGALADHLTSAGGALDGSGPQMSALAWIASGATASYGTVSEPCAHPQKFPHPQVLLLQYLQGATALEAYWKSVAWPQQGVFIGEPLAAPFARD